MNNGWHLHLILAADVDVVACTLVGFLPASGRT